MRHNLGATICPTPGCPNDADTCSTHSRQGNWTPQRAPDRQAQARLRQTVLRRDHHSCTRCHHHDPSGKTLVAHHIKPGYEPDAAITLCNAQANNCHGKLDAHAR